MVLYNLLFASLKEAAVITGIIFAMMVVIEFVVIRYQNKLIKLSKKNKFLNYIVSSFFGIIPGCIGTFAMDSLYMTGFLGFGGIIAVMIATSGDEAFMIMSMAAKGDISWSIVILLTVLLFGLGILGGFIADMFRKKMKMKFCEKCTVKNHKAKEKHTGHFLKEHVYEHIIKKHIWQIYLWLFAAIFVIGILQDKIDVDFTGGNLIYVLVLASLIGILPISGPNVFLIVMFSKGIIPFSILLANSIIQDGHGLLPIMGFSMDDAVKIKVFNFVFGFVAGFVLLMFGL